MEYVAGGNLKERIQRESSLPAFVATAIALQVAQALQTAHEHGVIHQNVQPQNILLTESGDAKVADFGLIRALSAVTMTQESAIPGTTRYLSPEQTLGQPASPQSDLYSLGVVLYEMLTGELPHDTETPAGTAAEHASRSLRPPREVNPDVPDRINAVTMRLLERKAKDRYQNAIELVEDLENVQRGESPAFLATQQEAARSAVTPAHPSVRLDSPPPHPRNAKNGVRRWRVLPWVLAAVILVGLVAAVALIIGSNM